MDNLVPLSDLGSSKGWGTCSEYKAWIWWRRVGGISSVCSVTSRTPLR